MLHDCPASASSADLSTDAGPSAEADGPASPLRAIFDGAHEFVGLLSPEGILLEANQAALDFAGVARDAVLGRPFRDSPWFAGTGPETLARLDAALAQAARGAFVRYEVEQRGADGRRAMIDFSLKPVLDAAGRVTCIIPEGRDVTERRRDEEERVLLLGRETAARAAAEAAERRARFLAEAGALLDASLEQGATLTHLAQLVVPTLASCCLIDVVEGASVRRTEVAHADPVRRARACALLHAPGEPARDPPLRESLRTGRARIVDALDGAALAALASDPAQLASLLALEPHSIIDVPLVARGHVLGAIVLVSDTPSGRRYDAADLALAEQLARRAALSLDNARLYEQARRATHQREEVLGIVSHDLRTPLSVVAMHARALEELGDTLPAGGRHAVAGIRESVEWLLRMMQDLLDVASIDAGRLRLERSPVDPVVLLAHAVELLEPLAVDAGLALHFEVPDHLPCVLADGDRVLQVLANLVGNAVKFTPAGGHVTVGAAAADGEVRMWVADTGAGIAPEKLPRVFDRFWHDDGASRVRGTGLGLAIARGIIEAHGGHVRAESVAGRGSTFTVSLPVAAEPTAAAR